MKTKCFLVLLLVLVVSAVPALAKEECFEGLAPGGVRLLATGATNLDVAVAEVATNPIGVAVGGIVGVAKAGCVVTKTAVDLTVGGVELLAAGVVGLPDATVAVATDPIGVAVGGVKGVLGAARWLGKITLGNCRK